MVDDDGKLKRKWINKRVNAQKEGIDFCLSFDEFRFLVQDAGLRSSDLGFTGKYYVLARYGDSGPYSFGNCRFITQAQNALEKKQTAKTRAASSKNAKIASEAAKAFGKPELSKRVRNGMSESEILRNRRTQQEQARAAKRAALNPSYTEERNSQYGSFWITDGSVNKKWSVSKGDIPEGFRRGRTIGRGY